MFEFDTLSGRLVVAREPGGGGAWGPSNPPPPVTLSLDLPAVPPGDALPGVAPAVAAVLLAGRPTPPPVAILAFAAPLKYLVVELAIPGEDAEGALRSLRPDAAALLAASPDGAISGAVVTCLGPPPAPHAPPTVLSRFFGPWMGIPEDPVTGSAHAVLAPHYGGRLCEAFGAGRVAAAARQLSARGGELGVVWEEGEGRVRLTGQCRVVVRGELWM